MVFSFLLTRTSSFGQSFHHILRLKLTLRKLSNDVNLNTRVFFSLIGKPFFRRLILPLATFLMAVSLLDPNVNWTALREQLATRDPWQVALTFTLLMLFWSITAGRALRPVWGQPTIAFLLRQPIGHWYWVWHLLPSLWIAFLPVVSIWWLAPHYAHPVLHYAGFVGLSWTIMLGASFRGLVCIKLIALGTAALALLIFGYAHQPWVAYLAIIVTIALLPMGITGIRGQLVLSRNISPSHLTSIWPLIAIVRRDLLCLWRLERKSLFSLVLPAVVVALMMFAIRVNAQVADRQAFVFACAFLAFAVMPTYEILTRLKTRLGPELMRQRWPVDHGDRAAALIALMCVLTGPTIIALAMLGSTMGLAYGMLFLLFAANTIVGLTALFSSTLVSPTPMLGWGLWLVFIHAILAIALPPWVYGVGAVAMLPLGISIMLKGLQMFTHQTEFGNLDQFA